MANTITSANSIYDLSIETAFPTPQRLQQFGTDSAFETEASDVAEVQLGVDGIAVSGWLPRLTTQTITLNAASISFLVFEEWVRQMDLRKDILYATATIQIPSIGRKYSLFQGTLTRFPPMPNARRTLEQRQFTIVWAPGLVAAPL